MLPAWAGWLSLILAVIFGVLSLIQFVQFLIDRKARSIYDKNVVAARGSLVALRAMCTESINNGEIIKTEASKQFVRQIAYMVLSIENTLTAIVPDRPISQP
jgi:hypothetical protein